MKPSNFYLLCLLGLPAVSAFALPTSISHFTETALGTARKIIKDVRGKDFTESLSKREGFQFDEVPDEWPKPKQLKGQILDERRCFENREHQYDPTPDVVRGAAWEFCLRLGSFVLNTTDDNGPKGLNASFPARVQLFDSDDSASIEVTLLSIENCSTGGDEIRDPAQPHQDYSCYDLVVGAWDECTWRGGAVDADCMRFLTRPYYSEEYKGEHWDEMKGLDLFPLALYTDRELDIYNGVNGVDIRGGECTVHTSGGWGGPRWQTCEEEQVMSD